MSGPWEMFQSSAAPAASPMPEADGPWKMFAAPPAAPTQDQPTPGVRFAPQGAPGPHGLVWDKDGGRDPKTGELVMAGRPMTENAPSQGLAAGASFLSGVPIVGPALESGAIKAGAYLRNKLYSDPAYQTESAVKSDIERSEAAYPKTSTAGGIGGGIVGTAPVVAEAPALFGVGPGGLTAGKIATGAAAGADIGAIDAAVRHGADGDAVKAGLVGGAAGGALGPVAGAVVSRGVNAVGRGLANILSSSPEGLSRPAAKMLARSAAADEIAGGEASRRISAAGPDGMIADAGPSTAGLLDTSIQRGGPGSTGARQAIEARSANVARDLGSEFDRTLGPEQGLHTAKTAIRTGSAPARSAAYDRAYESPIDYASAPGRALEAIVSNHVPAKAIEQANRLIRADPTAGPSRQIIAHASNDGSVTFERMPDVRQLDYITRGLNDVAAAENGKGALGGTTDLGRTYGNLSRAIRGQLRQAVPAYAEALETAAEPIAARNALQFGSELLKSSTPRDVAIETISHMTGPELTQARGGMRQALGELMANVQRTATDPNTDAREAIAAVKAFSSRAAQEKIGLLLGETDRQSIEAMLQRAEIQLGTRASLAGNSRTAGRQATERVMKDAMAPSVVDRALMGEPVRGGQAILQALTARRPADLAARQEGIYGELAHVLTGPRGPAASSVLEQILAQQGRRDRFGSIAGNLPIGQLSQTGLLGLLPTFNERSRLGPSTP